VGSCFGPQERSRACLCCAADPRKSTRIALRRRAGGPGAVGRPAQGPGQPPAAAPTGGQAPPRGQGWGLRPAHLTEPLGRGKRTRIRGRASRGNKGALSAARTQTSWRPGTGGAGRPADDLPGGHVERVFKNQRLHPAVLRIGAELARSSFEGLRERGEKPGPVKRETGRKPGARWLRITGCPGLGASDPRKKTRKRREVRASRKSGWQRALGGEPFNIAAPANRARVSGGRLQKPWCRVRIFAICAIGRSTNNPVTWVARQSGEPQRNQSQPGSRGRPGAAKPWFMGREGSPGFGWHPCGWPMRESGASPDAAKADRETGGDASGPPLRPGRSKNSTLQPVERVLGGRSEIGASAATCNKTRGLGHP